MRIVYTYYNTYITTTRYDSLIYRRRAPAYYHRHGKPIRSLCPVKVLFIFRVFSARHILRVIQ